LDPPTEFVYYGAQRNIEIDASNSTGGSNTLLYSWTVIPPQESSWWGVSNPIVGASNQDTLVLRPNFAGEWVIYVTVFDLCDDDTFTVNLDVSCPATITPEITTESTTIIQSNVGPQIFDEVFLSATESIIDSTIYNETTRNYEWTLFHPDGTIQDLGSGENVSFTPTVLGDDVYTVVLTFNDGCNWANTSITISTACNASLAPIAEIYLDFDVTQDYNPHAAADQYTFNATLSENVYSLLWTFTFTTADGEVLPSTTSTLMLPTFIPNQPGTLHALLNVSNGCETDSDEVTITFSCSYPSPTFTPLISNNEITWTDKKWPRVTLNGVDDFNSTYIDSYEWRFVLSPNNSYFLWEKTFQSSGQVIEYDFDEPLNTNYTVNTTKVTTTTTITYHYTRLVSDSERPPFGACFTPDVPGTYTLQLRVTDTCGRLHLVNPVTVTARCPSPTVSKPGNTKTVTFNNIGFTRVTMDGSQSTGNAPLIYKWAFVSIPTGIGILC
jgi:hypothetical protein